MQTGQRAPTDWRRRAAAAGVATIAIVSAIAAGAVLGGFIPIVHPSPVAEASGSESPMEPSINGSASPAHTEAAETTVPSVEPSVTPSPPAASPTPEPTEQPLVTWHVHDASATVLAGGIADVVVDANGRILSFFWGVDDASGEPLEVGVLAYYPATDAFEVIAPPLSSGGVGSDTYGLLGPGGLIYLFQWGPEDTSVSVFDPSADAWRPDEAATLEPGIGGGAVGGDGRIYITRFSGVASELPELLAYDPATKTTNLVASLPWRGPELVGSTAGLLVFADSAGVGTYDLTTGEWYRVAAQTPSYLEEEVGVGSDGAPRLLRIVEQGIYWIWANEEWRSSSGPQVVGWASRIAWLDRSWWIVRAKEVTWGGPLAIEVLQLEMTR